MELLKGKRAIVTGAASGIGEAIATCFAGHGARVALYDVNGDAAETVADSIRASGGEAFAMQGDVRDAAAVSALTQATMERFGGIDALVNNAGIYPRCPFLEMTDEKWEQVLSVNLQGVYRCTRAVAPHMVEHGAGRIVNISSVTFLMGMANLTHYVSSKGAIIGFTRSLARELGPRGVHVNAVTPGAIETEEEARFSTPEQTAAVVALQSLQWRLKPDHVARVCAFLCSPLSDGMTGQTLNVDGGWVMY